MYLIFPMRRIFVIFPIRWIIIFLIVRRIRTLFMRWLNIYRKSIFCSQHKLPNIPFGNLAKRIKFRNLSWPADSAKNAPNFSGMGNRCNNFNFFIIETVSYNNMEMWMTIKFGAKMLTTPIRAFCILGE